MFNYYLQLGLRNILQTPALNTLILTAIALGIAVSMTIMSLYHAMAHNPAGDKSHQLFAVQLASQGAEIESWSTKDNLPLQVTYQDAMNLRRSEVPLRQSPSYRLPFVLESTEMDVPPNLDFQSRAVDRDFFAMFELKFLYGGPWETSVDQHPAYNIVIDETVNQWAFGGGNNVGKTLLASEIEFTVVGIVENWHPLPNYHDLNYQPYRTMPDSVFVPYSLTPILEMHPRGNISAWLVEVINNHADFLKSEHIWLQYWVELPEEKDQVVYREYLQSYVEQQKQLGRFQNPKARGHIRDVSEWLNYNAVIDDDNRVMVGLSLMFLLVCMVNTVGLLLAKFLRRMNEAGIRRALGANRYQIFQQYLTEVALLGLAGGLLGLILTMFGLWGIRKLYEQYASIAYLDTTMVLATIGLSIIASTLTGIYPAYRVCMAQPSIFLKAQ